MDIFIALTMTIIGASTPLLFAAIGELVTERSGVLNLGVEGMMIIGAVCAFIASYQTQSAYWGIIAGMVSGIGISLLFALLTQHLLANHVASGLALTLFGLGLAGQIGENFTGLPGVKLHSLNFGILNDIPIIGQLLFGHDILVYISLCLIVSVSYLLFKTRWGLIIRAVGDNHQSAHHLGYDVIFIRYCCIMFGGACSGLAGAYLSLVYTTQWIENMTAGRGWIALALVVFATWLPYRIFIGAYLFGSVWILGLYSQGIGLNIPAQFLSSLPYIMTIITLLLIARNKRTLRKHTPACLTKIFIAER